MLVSDAPLGMLIGAFTEERYSNLPIPINPLLRNPTHPHHGP